MFHQSNKIYDYPKNSTLLFYDQTQNLTTLSRNFEKFLNIGRNRKKCLEKTMAGTFFYHMQNSFSDILEELPVKFSFWSIFKKRYKKLLLTFYNLKFFHGRHWQFRGAYKLDFRAVSPHSSKDLRFSQRAFSSHSPNRLN